MNEQELKQTKVTLKANDMATLETTRMVKVLRVFKDGYAAVFDGERELIVSTDNLKSME